MVLSWITYALALALLLAGAAAAESWLGLIGRQARWAWLAAMVLPVGLPAAYLAAPALLGGSLPAPDVVPTQWTPDVLAAPLAGSAEAGGGAPPFFEAWFPWVWAAVSAGVLGHAKLDRAALEVASELRWEPARLGGEPKAVWLGQPIRFTTG